MQINMRTITTGSTSVILSGWELSNWWMDDGTTCREQVMPENGEEIITDEACGGNGDGNLR